MSYLLIPLPSIFYISQNRTRVTMTLITLIIEREWLRGWWLGCWVFLVGTMPLAKYTNREKKTARERSSVHTYPLLSPYKICAGCSHLSPRHNITSQFNPAREYSNCNPFAMLKGDSCRIPIDRSNSMSIDIQIYLTEVPLPLTPLAFVSIALLFFFFLLCLIFPLAFSLHSPRFSFRYENRYT